MSKTERQKQSKTGKARLATFAVAVGLFCAIGVSLSRPVRAEEPPCIITECLAAPGAWQGYKGTVIASLKMFVTAFEGWVDNTIEELTKYANQTTNNQQNTTNAQVVMDDSRVTRQYTDKLGQERVRMAAQVMPSRSACVAATKQRDGTYSRYGGGGMTGSNAAIRTAETDANAIWSNAPGTPGEKGQLAYMNTRYGNRITRYNNPEGTGLQGNASIGKDRDLLPFESIFKQETLAAADDYTAAKDVMLNLSGDVVVDPVRGAQLTRTDGQTLALARYSDQAKLNLSASILMGEVERRRPTGGNGTTSEQAQMSNASYSTLAMKALVQANSGQAKGQNLDDLSVMIGDATRQLFVMYTFMEQWAAIRATSLAVDVKQSAAGKAGLATRVMQAN